MLSIRILILFSGDPHANVGLTDDAFKTLFVARIVSFLCSSYMYIG